MQLNLPICFLKRTPTKVNSNPVRQLKLYLSSWIKSKALINALSTWNTKNLIYRAQIRKRKIDSRIWKLFRRSINLKPLPIEIGCSLGKHEGRTWFNGFKQEFKAKNIKYGDSLFSHQTNSRLIINPRNKWKESQFYKQIFNFIRVIQKLETHQDRSLY